MGIGSAEPYPLVHALALSLNLLEIQICMAPAKGWHIENSAGATYTVIGIGSVGSTHWRTPFSRYDWFPPNLALRRRRSEVQTPARRTKDVSGGFLSLQSRASGLQSTSWGSLSGSKDSSESSKSYIHANYVHCHLDYAKRGNKPTVFVIAVHKKASRCLFFS